MRVQARRLMLSAFVVATNALPRPLPPQTLQLPPQTLQLAAHATAIDIDVEALARKYAPTTVFSPLEKFFFADPVKYLSAATLAKPSADGKSFTDLGKVADMTESDFYARMVPGGECSSNGKTRGGGCFLYNAEWRRSNAPKANEGLLGTKGSTLKPSADGLDHESDAPLYYTAITNAERTQVTLNFLNFYAWNGCGVISTTYPDTSSFGAFFSKKKRETAVMCPFGAHEADWESASVVVDIAADGSDSLNGVITSAHGDYSYTSAKDATLSFDTASAQGESHAVVYSALNGHPVTIGPHKHAEYKDLGNIGLLKLVAETAQKYPQTRGAKLWRANGQNLKRVPFGSIAEAEASIRASATSTSTAKGGALLNSNWAALGLIWGHGYSEPAQGTVTCIQGSDGYANKWETGSCRSVIWKTLAWAMKEGITAFVSEIAKFGFKFDDIYKEMVGGGAQGGKEGWFHPASKVCTTDPRSEPHKETCTESSGLCFPGPGTTLPTTPTACTPFVDK